MHEEKRVFIIIPVYNEEPVIIQEVLDEVFSAGFDHICLVDDGSHMPVSTSIRPQKHVHIIRHAINRGKGAAIKTGILAATARGAEVVVTFDGDGQHDARDIAPMLAQLTAGHNVVLGSRREYLNDMPFYKKIANHIGNFATWALYGLRVRDSQAGLRAYDKKAIAEIDVQSDRYAYDSEVIREIYRLQLRYCEMPIRVRYTDYAKNKQTRQGLRNGLKTLVHMIYSSK